MKFDSNFFRNEPVLIAGLVQAVLVLLLAFGFSISEEQIGAVMAVVSVALALLARMFVSPKSTPVEDPPVV